MIFRPILLAVAALLAIARASAQDPNSQAPRKATSSQILSPNQPDMPLLAVQNGLTAEQLIQDVFIGGDCFDVSNIQISGGMNQVAKFTNGQISFGINEGIVLSTGTANEILGPNNGAGNGSTISFNSMTDPDLTKLTGQTTAIIRDRVTLEFDFRPTKNVISFQYVFASEEYCEYVGSVYNDVFGFFISGPGITGGFSGNSKNIALVPGSSEYIAINNVNHQSNSGFYVSNIPPLQFPIDPDCWGVSTSTGIATQELQFDGFTTIFTATANVQPCQTYHIRLKIADIGDGLYNSAVFLKASSFNAGGNADLSLDVPMITSPGMAYEGCPNPSLVFTRLGQNIGVPETVNFTIDPASTALNGVDFASIPTSIVIPAGQMTANLPLLIVDDNLPEGNETLILGLDNFCNCSKSTVTLTIADSAPLTVKATDASLCQAQSTLISAQPTGGVGTLNFVWNNGSVGPNFNATPSGSTNYIVTVTDGCGTTAIDTASVLIVGNPSAQTSGSFTVCNGNPAEIPISFIGGGPSWNFSYTFNGATTNLTGITQNPFLLPANLPGNYSLVAVSSNGCTGPASGQATVGQGGFTLTAAETDISCSGKNDGKISLTTTGGLAPFNFEWANSPDNLPSQQNLPPGNYLVTVTDGNGCFEEKTIQLVEPQSISLAIAAINGVDCNDPTGGSINLSATGGTGVFTFKWSGSGGTTEDPTGLAAGNFSVTATDANACTATISATVPADFDAPTAMILPPQILTCLLPKNTLDGSQSESGPGFSAAWATVGGQFLSAQNSLKPEIGQPGTYFLTIKNETNGCTSTASVLVEADQEKPRADAGADGELTCFLEKIKLDGTQSSTGPEFNFNWTATGGGQILTGQTTLTPEIDQPGNYQLVVTDTSNGCTETDEITVIDKRNKPSGAGFAISREKCAASAEWLLDFVEGGEGPFSLILDNGQPILATEFSGLMPGLHSLSIVGANGCAFDTSFLVPNFTLPTLVVDPSVAQIRLGDSLLLNGFSNLNLPGIASLNWSPDERTNCPDCLKTWVQPFENTVFTLVLTDSAGCTASAQARIEVDKSWDVFVPNAFSPDDDGLNDWLTIYANPSVVTDIPDFRIFDRWGNLVFARQNFQPNIEIDGWDGRLREKVLAPAVFVWLARLELLDGRQVDLKGNVTLVR